MKKIFTSVNLIGTIIFLSIISKWSLAQEGTWQSINAMPTEGRAAAVAFVINDRAYVGTGINFSNAIVSQDFWQFDPITQSWTQVADFGGGSRSGACAFAIGDKGYVATGYGAGGKTSELWQYDTDLNLWTQKNNLPSTPRNYAVAFAIGNKGYVGTGYSDNDNLNDFWQYDPSTNTWTEKASFPGDARSSAIGFAVDGKGYIGGGYISYPASDFYGYDTLTNTWESLAMMGDQGRTDAMSFVINGRGYVCAGDAALGGNHDLLEYNISLDTWTVRAALPGSERTDGVAFGIDGKGYLGTGWDNSFNETSDFYEFAPDSAVATAIASVPSSNSLIISPNPVSDKAIIVLRSAEKIGAIHVQIISEDGQRITPGGEVLYEYDSANEKKFVFSRNHLPAGNYFISLWSETKFLASGKIVLK